MSYVYNSVTNVTTTTYTVKYTCDNCGTQQITPDNKVPRSCNTCGMLFLGQKQ